MTDEVHEARAVGLRMCEASMPATWYSSSVPLSALVRGIVGSVVG